MSNENKNSIYNNDVQNYENEEEIAMNDMLNETEEIEGIVEEEEQEREELEIVSYQQMLEEWMKQNDKRISNPFLTKYEYTRLVGVRAQQLSRGAIPLVDCKDLTRTLDIAEKELKERKIPLMIKRLLPGKKYELWKIEELIF
jgi:DNA-directed RNA polymerase I, II, and III subunit RPABC2